MSRYDSVLRQLEHFTTNWIKEHHDHLPEEVVKYFLLRSYVEEHRAYPEERDRS